jgi:4-amino-4-deoxy-L-arabinose transferase-like glycosyltransferase
VSRILSRLERPHRIVLLALFAAALYLPALGRPALWEPDEGRYAEIAREMILSGDYITPRNDFVRYFEKPPLMYWTTAASMRLFGLDELAARLPAALFSIGEVVVTLVLAESVFGATAGMLAAIALALSPLVFGFARFLTLDPALAFFVTAALGCFYTATLRPDLGSGSGRMWLYASAAMVALGTLTKGPVALVICGGVALIYLLVERRARDLLRIPWIGCAVIYFAIVLPWFVLVARRNPEFLSYFFVHEHLHRYLANTEHSWGPWFLVAVAAGGTWPWLYFAPSGLRASAGASAGDEARYRSAVRFLAIWLAFVLVFFSIPRSKLGSYVLPGIPPIAIAAGIGLSRLSALSSPQIRRMLGRFAILNMIAALAGGLVLLFFARRLLPPLAAEGIIAMAILGVAAVAAFIVGRDAGGSPGAIAAVAGGVIAMMVVAMVARETASPLVSYRRLALAIRPYLKGGCLLASYRHQVQSLPFYTGRREAMVDYFGELGAERNNPDAAASFLRTDQLARQWASSCVVLIANRRDVDTLRRTLSPAPIRIACEGKKLALYNGPVTRPLALDCLVQNGKGSVVSRKGRGLVWTDSIYKLLSEKLR